MAWLHRLNETMVEKYTYSLRIIAIVLVMNNTRDVSIPIFNSLMLFIPTDIQFFPVLEARTNIYLFLLQIGYPKVTKKISVK